MLGRDHATRIYGDPNRERYSLDKMKALKVFPLPVRPPTNLAKRMRWSPDGKSVIYKDSLAGLWRQRLDADKPGAIKGFEDLQIYQLAWSLNGKTLAYTRGANMQEIVLLQSSK